MTGVVLVIPVLLMFFYGPRGDRPPDRAGPRWMPRYRFGAAALWSALIPLAAGAFVAYLAARGFGAAGPVSAQQHFSGHRFVLPFVGAWDGVLAAIHQFRLELLGATGSGFEDQAMFQLGVLASLCWRWRHLPAPALCLRRVCGVRPLLALASPTSWDPLRGLARYAMVLFPLCMGAASWAVDRGAVRRLLIGSAAAAVPADRAVRHVAHGRHGRV